MKKPLSVTWEQVAAFRTKRHHLNGDALRERLLSVIDDMTGAQAQLYSAAQLSLSARIKELQVADIEKALNDRRLVKAACMRSTLFLVPSEYLGIYARGAARRAEKEIRWALGKGVPERSIDTAIQAALEVLDRPLTRPEIAELVSIALGQQQRLIHGGGWGRRSKVAAVQVGELTYPVVDLLHLASARGIICYGPARANEPTFVRADTWIPNWHELPWREAEDEILRRYLRAYGPATVSDFSLWFGIALKDARDIWTRQAAKFETVNIGHLQATILQEDFDELQNARFEVPQIQLLPYFDSYLLGHKSRDHLVSKQYQPQVFRAQGWIAPVVLFNGRAVAVWAYTQQRSRLSIKISQFEKIPKAAISGINAEALHLGHFLGSQVVDVQFG